LDWGGVLIDDPAPSLIFYCSKALGVSAEHFAEVHKRFLPKFQRGLIPEAEFWRRVCAELNIRSPTSISLWGEAFRKVYSPKEKMFDLAAFLKSKSYKTALLSNTEEPAVRYFRELNYHMFDVVIFSCCERKSKPERKIYELTLSRLKTNPSEVIFIDDRTEYIDGAKQIGMNTILFQDVVSTFEKLASFSMKLRIDLTEPNTFLR
jgi:putative hydrolase of the HAD superfamily